MRKRGSGNLGFRLRTLGEALSVYAKDDEGSSGVLAYLTVYRTAVISKPSTLNSAASFPRCKLCC